jgi:hypothetical protein
MIKLPWGTISHEEQVENTRDKICPIKMSFPTLKNSKNIKL